MAASFFGFQVKGFLPMVAMTMEPADLEQGYPKRYVPTRLPQQHVARDFTLHHFSYEMYEHNVTYAVSL